jgi:hypothetical protein
MSKLLFIICMLMPHNVEEYLYNSECIGNFGINGIWLDIYYKRNLFYFSLIILLLSYLLNYIYYGLFFCIFCFYLYVKSCNKWYIFLNYKK